MFLVYFLFAISLVLNLFFLLRKEFFIICFIRFVSRFKSNYLLDTVPIVVFELDSDFNFTYVNKYGVDLFGVEAKDLCKKVNVLDVILEKEMVKKNYAQLGMQGGFKARKYTAVKKDGTQFPIVVDYMPQYRNGKLYKLVGYLIDSEYVRASEEALKKINRELESRIEEGTRELRETNERLLEEISGHENTEQLLLKERGMLDNIINLNPYAIMVVDKEGYLVKHNPAFVELFGNNPPGDYCIYTDPVLRKTGMSELFKDIASHEVLNLSEIIYLKNDVSSGFPKKQVRVSSVAFPIYDADKNLENIVIMHQDISFIKTAEEALLSQVEFMQTVIDTIPNPIFYKDVDGNFLGCNTAMTRMLGFEREDILGKNIYDVLGDDDVASNIDKMDKSLFENPGIQIYESTLSGRTIDEKRVVYYKATYNNIKGDIAGLVGTIIDITERKKEEMQRESLLKQLGRVNKDLSSFAYIVSHDLKAPLRAIGTLSYWISNDYNDRFDEEGRKQMELLIGRVKRMHGLIDGVLAYSRVGRVREERRTLDLNEIVKEVIDILDVPTNFDVKITKKLPSVNMEETRSLQLFQNLIGNAIKYHDKEEGIIEISSVEEDDGYLFCVKDDGPGISEKYHEKVFQIFQTLSPRDKTESTGVGLALVKKIVELYNGEIWIESEEGKGSSFYFRFPKNIVKTIN